jgi:hypothetical protein
MNWKQLCQERGSQLSIQVINAKVFSILCGSEQHNDFISKEKVEYIVPNRKQYKRSVEYLKNNMRENITIKIYRKEYSNCWHDMGIFMISSIVESPISYNVSLILIK